jgi:hypothetical protein
MNRERRLSWMAGVFEGEGSVHIQPVAKRNYCTMCVSMVNTDVAMVIPFFKRYGGTLRVIKRNDPNHRRAFRWQIAAQKADRFLEEIYPFIQTVRVRRKIKLARAFQSRKSSGKGRLTPAYRVIQMSSYRKMRELNKRGAA